MKLTKSIAMALMVASLSGCLETGTGEKIGMITKIAKQGALCPTWEAEIVRGGFSGGNGVNGQAFHFTVGDEETANKIRAAMESQKEVKITGYSDFAVDGGQKELPCRNVAAIKRQATKEHEFDRDDHPGVSTQDRPRDEPGQAGRVGQDARRMD